MNYINLLCVLVWLVRASEGLHADPPGYARNVLAKVRRYAVEVPTAEEVPLPLSVPLPRRPLDSPPLSLVPTFRAVPADYVAAVDPANVATAPEPGKDS